MKNLFFLCLMLISVSMMAQKDETLFNKSGLRLTGGWGGWSNGITAFGDDYGVVSGGFGGLEFGKSLLIGYGSYETSDEGKYGFPANGNVNLNYGGLMLGYAPHANKVIHPQFLLLAGAGNAAINGENKDKIFAIQPSAGIEVNVFRWMRVGVTGGYRFITDTDSVDYQDKDFSSAFGEVTFKFGWSWGR